MDPKENLPARGPSPDGRWPGRLVTLFRGAAPFELCDAVAAEAAAIAECPNYWVPREAIERGQDGLLTVGEAAVAALYARVMKGALGDVEWAGAEWWTQVYEPGKGLAFHFDKDEEVMKTTGGVLCPIFSSVYYLCAPEGQGVPRLGPTVILDQRFDQESAKPVPDNPERCALVYPTKNSYCVFDGGLSHGVLDASSSEVRQTLLVNWWASQPKNVSRVTEADIEKFKLTQLNSVASDQTEQGQQELGDTLSVPSTAESFELAATVSVAVPEADAGSPFLVDDLLSAFRVQVEGELATDMVAISYKGMALMPLADEQAAACSTAAALVPLSMLGESDEEEEEGDQ